MGGSLCKRRFSIDVINYTSNRSDLCRVNFEVSNLNPYSYLAFPHLPRVEILPKSPSFDGGLMASFCAHAKGGTNAERLTH